MHYWKLHIGDWMRGTAHLSDAERGLYMVLLLRYYDTESPLPADKQSVCRIACARNASAVQSVCSILDEFFTLSEDGWHNKRADAEIAEYRSKKGKAKNSADARWAKERANSENSVSEGNADVMRTHSEGNANHKPLTTNHKPPTKDQEHVGAVAPVANAPKQSSEKGTRLPIGWLLPSDWVIDATDVGIPSGAVQIESDKFRDYWIAKAGSQAVKRDWRATWRNWCRSAWERTYRGKPTKPSRMDISGMDYNAGVDADGNF